MELLDEVQVAPLEAHWERFLGSATVVEIRSAEVGKADRQWERAAGAAARESCVRRLLARGAARDRIRLSLSHSGDQLLCIGARDVTSIGVDLERLDRAPDPRAVSRFQRASEVSFALLPIELWCIKEACFKANPENEGTVIPQYRVSSFVRSDIGGQGQAEIAGARFGFDLCHLGGWVVVLAQLS